MLQNQQDLYCCEDQVLLKFIAKFPTHLFMVFKFYKFAILLVSALVLFSGVCFAQELCTNGIDDDGDGLIDLNDSLDCECGNGVLEPIPSFVPNASFDDFNFCPDGFGQADALVGWIQGTAGTTDYLNTCDFTYFAGSAGLLPFPDGSGVVGAFYLSQFKEYIAFCPTEPLVAGQEYTLSFFIASSLVGVEEADCLGSVIDGIFPTVDVSLFGAPSCDDLPVFTFLCPTAENPAWTVAGSVAYDPAQNWQEVSMTFTPSFNMESLMLGAPCFLPQTWSAGIEGDCRPYFYYDNLVLNRSSEFQVVNGSISGPNCGGDITLQSSLGSLPPLSSIQWFLNGIAIVGANESSLSVPSDPSGYGAYQVGVYTDSQCALSDTYELKELPPLPVAAFTSTMGNTLRPGEKTELVNESINASTYFWDVCGESMFAESITLTFDEAGTCCVSLFAIEGNCSDSTSQCFDLEILPGVQVPNIFTPNGDGANDFFSLNTSGVKTLNCAIFNRWGKEIFVQKNDINIQWDGSISSGNMVPSGVYFYVIDYFDFQDLPYSLTGTLTVVRD